MEAGKAGKALSQTKNKIDVMIRDEKTPVFTPFSRLSTNRTTRGKKASKGYTISKMGFLSEFYNLSSIVNWLLGLNVCPKVQGVVSFLR